MPADVAGERAPSTAISLVWVDCAPLVGALTIGRAPFIGSVTGPIIDRPSGAVEALASDRLFRSTIPWARSSMAEQLTLNQRVDSSSLSGLTNSFTHETTPAGQTDGGL